MKKFFGLLVMMLMITSNCFAMTFSQPVKLGSIGFPPANGIIIMGATYNSSSPIGKFQNNNLYSYGTSAFGNGTDMIYCHYDKNPLYFGDKNKNNSIKVDIELYGVNINQIRNDSNLKLYILHTYGAMVTSSSYVCLGRKKDGAFVQYFDTRDVIRKYFGSQLDRTKLPYCTKVYCKGSSIVIEYTNLSKSKQGEFRFKWDDAAQWFGVEHIVY